MKHVSVLEERLRHLHRPQMFKTHSSSDTESPTMGQRFAELAAAGIGSWRFLIIQATLLALWVIYNSIALTHHFDSFPYILLNLAMSFQAAFTGPILLIAANVGAIRDHAQADRIERLTAQNEKLAEQNRALVEGLTAMEQTLDGHVGASLQAHAAELHELSALVRSVHAAVTNDTAAPAVAITPELPALEGNESAVPAADPTPTPAAESTATRSAIARTTARPTRRRRWPRMRQHSRRVSDPLDVFTLSHLRSCPARGTSAG
jgi:uncharacterized membrane protein